MTMSPTGRRAVFVGLLLIAALVPAVFLIMIGREVLAPAVIYGSAIAVTGLMYGARLGVTLSLVGGGVAFASTLLHPYPIAGGLFFGAVVAGSALTSRRGVHSAAMMVPVFTAFILVAPIDVFDREPTALAAVVVGLTMCLSGLWVIAVARLLLGQHLPQMPRHPVGQRTSRIYAVVSGIIVGVAAGIMLAINPSHPSAWLLLTLLLLLQPDPHDSTVKTLQRLIGTVAGGLISLLFVLLPLPSSVSLSIGSAVLFAALILRFVMRRPYWEYIVAITVGIILLDSTADNRVEIAEDRVIYTLLGGLVVIVVALVAKVFLRRYEREHPAAA